MAGMAGRASAVKVLSVLMLWAASALPAAAQVTPGTAKVISTPGTSSTSPQITFHPSTGQYGIAYREPGPRRWVGAFLDQDGNRVTNSILLLNDNGNTPNLRKVVPFPFSTAALATFEAYGYDSFGNNVFIGDAAGVAFVNNGVTSGLVNYTNNGNDKFVANNCGEHEEIGASATDPASNKFFLSYTQSFHQHNSSNGTCQTTGSQLMAAYHQNGLPFGFSNGPFFVESGAAAQDAAFNPATGQVWLGYASATQGRLSVALVTPSGIGGSFMLTAGGDGIFRGNLKFAVHPVTNNVLVVWTEFVNSNPTVKARMFTPNAVALTADITLSNPATERILNTYVAATADNFFIAGFVVNHVLGRVLTPAGAIASDWTRVDFLTDQFGNPANVNFGVSLAANPTRGTYGLVVDSFSDIYFIEVTASAGVPLTVVANGTGAGAITSDPPGINCPGTCSMSVPPGTDVELFAAPATFSDFTGWGGACSGTGACSLTLTAPTTVNATFTRQRFPISVTRIGDGTVLSSPAGIDCGPTCSADFDGGSIVHLTAAAASGWRFDGWSGACTGSGACNVAVAAADSVTATFVQQFTLSVTASGNGAGHVTSNPLGIDCPGPACSITVDAGTSVELLASADATSRFSGWSGACTGGACVVTVSSDSSANAAFVRQFDVQTAIAGSGSVASSPAGIACPGDCSERFDTGTDVVLTATPAAGWRFTGWSGGAACTGSGTCTISAAAYQLSMVTATFVEQFPLTVSLAGNGSGSVSGPGIACPGDCSETYDANTPVTLNATPDASSVFTGWGGACSGTGACDTTMSAAQSVTATFTLRQYSLSVAIAGAGAGSVTGSGIACPGDCSESFDHGTVVTLAAVADAVSVFSGWSGACSGTGACVVTMTSAQSVTATFIPRPTYPLSVTLTGAGSGSVGSNPAGISCGPTCAADFDAGTIVTLTATAGATSTFAGWSGACSGTGACVVTMSAAQSVTATFDAVTIATVTSSIAALAPVIGSGSVNSVSGKLSNAQASLTRSNRNAATNQLNAAINEITALVRSRRLDAATGAALIANLQAIIAGL
jgi:hypothetical protein